MPSDYKAVRPWVPRDDPARPELMKILGANGVALGIPEVLHALQTGTVDTVVASALAAVALQWFRHVEYVSQNAEIAIVGATLVRADLFQALAPEHQKALLDTGKDAHAALVKKVQSEDTNAYVSLTTKLGLKVFDPAATPEQRSAWE